MTLQRVSVDLIGGLATTTDITYYVATTGSDSNNGLTAGTPFLTIQHTIDMLPQIINHNVTINVAEGTYAENVVVNGFLGNGEIDIIGNTSSGVADLVHIINSLSISNCTLTIYVRGFNATITSTSGFYVSTSNYVYFNFLRCEATTATYAGVDIWNSHVYMTGCITSNRYYGISASSGSLVRCNGCTGSGNTRGFKAIGTSIIGHNVYRPTGALPDFVSDGGIITTGGITYPPSSTTADITYYVATTGSDSNDGFTADKPFKTIQHAIDTIPQVVNHIITINVEAGVYSETVTLYGKVGLGGIYIYGDTVISTSRTVWNFDIWNNGSVFITVRGFYCTNSTGPACNTGSSMVYFSYMNIIDSVTSQYGIVCYRNGLCWVVNSTISNRSNAIIAVDGGHIISSANSGTGNTLGLQATSSGKIARIGTQPTGTTAMTYVQTGGMIVDSNGIPVIHAGTDYTTARARNITLSTSDPTGGSSGDVWIKYTA